MGNLLLDKCIASEDHDGETATPTKDKPGSLRSSSCSLAPKLPAGLDFLCDFALAQVRDPEDYRCVLIKLDDQDLAKIKKLAEASKSDPKTIISTNDALFALSLEEDTNPAETVAIAFPMDQRGVYPELSDMLGNATRTVRKNLKKGDLKTVESIRAAVKNRPSDPLYVFQDLLKPLLFTAGAGLLQKISRLLMCGKTNNGVERSAFPIPTGRSTSSSSSSCCKLPVTLQHVSWVKVQYFPKNCLCQKPIQLDNDPRLVLRKVHHHGSLFTQFQQKKLSGEKTGAEINLYTLRFCHRKEVVEKLLRKLEKIKDVRGGSDGEKNQWYVDIN